VAQPTGKKTPVWPFIVGGAVLLAIVCVVAVVVGALVLRDSDESTADRLLPDQSANSADWQGQLAAIDGVVKYDADALSRDHADGPVDYPQQPPVGGKHNNIWQNCSGRVYDKPIANEHAVHSLEHGAVWITYREGATAAQVKKLADRVQGVDYTMLSPVAGQSSTVSLQAWGYQLTVSSVDDKRIDAFIRAARINATQEPGATCAGGTTQTGAILP
jgi:hypothetical protein